MRPALLTATRVLEGAAAGVLIVGVAALLFYGEEEPAAYGALLVPTVLTVAAAATTRWRAVAVGFVLAVVVLVGVFLAVLLLFVGG